MEPRYLRRSQSRDNMIHPVLFFEEIFKMLLDRLIYSFFDKEILCFAALLFFFSIN